jgi:4,5-DOPA dioxygenase extradiol
MTLPALYLSHGAPPLLDDEIWKQQLRNWSSGIEKPKGILVVSAHWENAPVAISSTDANTPLIYDFGGFAPKYYNEKYETPDAAWLGALVASVMPDTEPLHQSPRRGLDHGAWVPVKIMYPDSDIPVIQLSLPTHDPVKLMELGARLRPLRDHGILIVGSGFMTHGLPFLREFRIEATPPEWSVEFDHWVAEAMNKGDIESLINYKAKAPGMPFAHPTVEHFTPLFVSLGASLNPEQIPEQKIDGFWMGLSKRSFEVA